MMDKRLRYFHFAESLPVDEIVEVEPCAQCFSRWVCEGDGVGEVSANAMMPEAQSAASPSVGSLPPAAAMDSAPMQAAPAVAAAVPFPPVPLATLLPNASLSFFDLL